MAKKRVTIKDLANETGLSAQAVSRALRGKDDIAPATRQKVLDTAERLGYIKNLAASSLKAGRSRLIAVVYDNLLNPYFSIMTEYLQEYLTKFGYSILVLTVPRGRINKKAFHLAVSRGVDGVITFLEPECDMGELARAHEVPIILLGRSTDHPNIDYLKTDDRTGGAMAAARLVDSGCKRPLCVVENLELTCAKERFDGYREELIARGLFDPQMVIVLNDTKMGSGYDEIKRRGLDPDGIFCFNDIVALEIASQVRNDGADIKIVGYDNIQADIKIPYRLTTIGSDKQQMASVAAEVLIYKMENPENMGKPFKKLHEVFLVEGESG